MCGLNYFPTRDSIVLIFFIIFVEFSRRRHVFSIAMNTLCDLLTNFKFERNHFLAATTIELIVLTNVMESLTNTNVGLNELEQQRSKLEVMNREFEEKIGTMPIEEQVASAALISELRVKVAAMRTSMADTLENRLIYGDLTGTAHEQASRDLSRDEILNNSYLYTHLPDGLLGDEILEKTDLHVLQGDLSSRHENDIEMKDDSENSNHQSNEVKVADETSVQTSEIGKACEFVKGNDDVAVNTTKRNEKIDSATERNLTVQSDQNKGTEIELKSTSDILANAANTEGGFSYSSIVMYITALNELQLVERMPSPVTVNYLKGIRDFVTKFVVLCKELHLNFQQLEPVMISKVVASFNSDVMKNWEYFMITHRASLKTIREFLATQQEMADDTRLNKSREMLAKAIRSAQAISKPKGIQAVPKSRECSRDRTMTIVKSPYDGACRDPTSGAVSKVKSFQPGSGRMMKENSKGAKGKEKQQRSYVCLGCEKDHPLFYCPRYLSKSLEDRVEYLEKANICKLCLLERHDIMICPDRDCKNCWGQPHNSTICPISYAKKRLPPKGDGRKGG